MHRSFTVLIVFVLKQDQNEDENKASSFQRKWVWQFFHLYLFVYTLLSVTDYTCTLMYSVFPALGRGFHLDPSRKRWRGWLRQRRSASQPYVPVFCSKHQLSVANGLLLALHPQKSELTRFPDVTQRTLVLLEEVSRKREIFEKEQQVQSPTSPGVSKQVQSSFAQKLFSVLDVCVALVNKWFCNCCWFQEIRGLTSGMSERINRWLHKSNKAGSSHSPAVSAVYGSQGAVLLFEL